MLRKIYNKDSIMEYFFLILFALMIFFWMVKKESQKIEQMNLQQWRHLYERTGQLETFFHTYKEVNQFYQTAQKELDKVNNETLVIKNNFLDQEFVYFCKSANDYLDEAIKDHLFDSENRNIERMVETNG